MSYGGVLGRNLTGSAKSVEWTSDLANRSDVAGHGGAVVACGRLIGPTWRGMKVL